jgi:hypothetical protein
MNEKNKLINKKLDIPIWQRSPTEKEQEYLDEVIKKYIEDQGEQSEAGIETIKYDRQSEYYKRIEYNGKYYLRSTSNLNVYSYEKYNIIVGRWNNEEQKIEFVE